MEIKDRKRDDDDMVKGRKKGAVSAMRPINQFSTRYERERTKKRYYSFIVEGMYYRVAMNVVFPTKKKRGKKQI